VVIINILTLRVIEIEEIPNDSESQNVYNNENFKGFLMTRSVKILILEIPEVTSN
jgi:hypothetical protein